MLHPLPLLLCILAILSSPAPVQAQPTDAGDGEIPTLRTFERDVTFAFGTFQDHVRVHNAALHLTAPNGRGGLGYVDPIQAPAGDERAPVLHVTVGPDHRAGRIALVLKDAQDRERVFEYDLSDLPVGRESLVYPRGGELLVPDADEADAFDPRQINNQMLRGNWQNHPYDLRVHAVQLRPLTAALQQVRQQRLDEARAEQQRQREAQQRRDAERDRLLADGADHPADGPRVAHVGALGPDLLAIHILEREHTPARQIAYEPQPDDTIRESGRPMLAWQDGRPALAPSSREVRRPVEGRSRPATVGILLSDGETLSLPRGFTGQRITDATVAAPRAYRIQSTSDNRFADGVIPTAVHHKALPFGTNDDGVGREHWVYLQLPQPLREGERYTLEFTGVNTAQQDVALVYDTRQLRSPAVHASHVGYRPDDPFKRAYLSAWLGTGGAHAFDADRFELLDEAGQVVFEGAVEQVLAQDQTEGLIGDRNHTGTHVWAMDFGGFTAPGTYRVHVPGVGVSHPFPIARDAWTDAFTHVMQGLLTHRSGIALPADLAGYERPRPMHPDDGFTVLQADVTRWDGESSAIRESLERLVGEEMDASEIPTLPEAWGGYMDAGDWDRRAHHLSVSYGLLELYAMFPEFFDQLTLTVPEQEADNDIPDLLDEVLWNVMFYRRLQRDDGAVRGGVESTAHPRSGEASWQESLLVAAFEPDPEACYQFASSAAKTAGLLEPFAPDTAADLADAAVRAWDWAQANAQAEVAAASQREVHRADQIPGRVQSAEALAAVELYRLTRDERYHEAFIAVTPLTRDNPGDQQLDAAFAYATLPAELQDPQLARAARDLIVDQADTALTFGQNNAFGISIRVPRLPMIGWVGYYSVPETSVGPTLPRAHHLTGEPRYLAAALQATQYAVGANPRNMTMTTGLGHDYPRFPLHVDSRNAGLPTPPGIVVYGPHVPSRAPGYVRQWSLQNNIVPDVSQWPAAEAYIDLGNWVEMNEYTVHQTIGPTAYYWGYLAARSSDAARRR
jgi:endoglucanase